MSRRSFGMHARIIAAFSAVIILVIACLAGILHVQKDRLAKAALITRATGISEILARLMVPAVSRGDTQEAQRVLSVMQGNPDLRYMALVRNGDLLAHWSQPAFDPGEELREESRTIRVVESDDPKGLVHILAPVVGGEGYLGTVVMGCSPLAIYRVIGASQLAVWGIALAVLLLGILVAILLSRSLQRPIRIVAGRLSQLSQDLVDSARGQESAGTQQAGGIAQTRRTMERVLGSAQQIAEKSSLVLGNAERTVLGNRAVAVRIKELNSQAERANEILAAIMQVADRTDLLALNAALEGTKAGEAGRGFTLVAAEMRRLAENTMESVNGIRQLMNEMRVASQMAVQAGHEGVALSEETTRSAREIAQETQQQRMATEEVGQSMDDMAASVSEAMSRTRNTASHAAELAQAANKLSLLVGGGWGVPSDLRTEETPSPVTAGKEGDR